MSERLKVCIRNIACGVLFILLLAAAGTASVVINAKSLQNSIYTVSIYDDGRLTEIRTTSLSVSKALEIAQIKLGEHDIISTDIDEMLNPDDTNIYVGRARKINLTIGDEEKVVYTLKDSVEQVLAENQVQVSAYDYVNAVLETPLTEMGNSIVYKNAIPITLSINGIDTIVYSTKNTIGEVLEENGYSISDEDFVNQKASDKITLDNTKIAVVTAHKLTLKYDGATKIITTQAKNVEELLNEQGVKLSGLDKLANGVTINSKIKENMVVSVIRVKETKVTETVTLPYQTKKENNDSLMKGFTKVVSKGANGTRTDTYTIVTENGKQVSKNLTNSVVTKKPVDAVTQVGTKTYVTLSSNFELKGGYSKVMDVTAVAYNLEGLKNRPPSDPNYGKTANGMKVRAGIIAVDKRVIPLGTKVYVEVLNGPDYGYAIAADVGVSGYTVDLYMNSYKECINFGRRKARVYILSDQSVDVFKLRGD